MAIRKSLEETISVNGEREMWIEKCKNSLTKAGFKNITANSATFQISGDYKKFTVYGEILLTLLPENNSTKIIMKATANMDNIYALFNSPTKAILSKFKDVYKNFIFVQILSFFQNKFKKGIRMILYILNNVLIGS